MFRDAQQAQGRQQPQHRKRPAERHHEHHEGAELEEEDGLAGEQMAYKKAGLLGPVLDVSKFG